MDIKVEDYEKLGAFYLGREYDIDERELRDELLLYDSKDLVTHGVVLGMTGSGKTGLCLSMLEEAAMDDIPAIIIDPKGDIANLMLNFPDFKGSDYRPWINEDDAQKKGQTPDEFAQAQADLWKKGLGEWGQSPERVRQFREKVDVNIFTPGSNAGIPVSIISSLAAPPFEIIDDAELFGDQIESTVSSLLSLMGIDADPIQSREHILLSTIFATCWQREENLDLAKLINYIQMPPFQKVGVLDLDSFFDEKKRFGLAMQMNNLLAAPGFQTWMTGAALDIKRMLHSPEGKPRMSIFSIAHLSDSERMFFVSLLLNQMLSWMRQQSGTTSLRAMLYMDEIYGYLPPTANPPSKKPMMTMLKQARAFGVGVLLATQNPVDLDYKALSNMGTWFLGRLQTERDKMRVLDGLEGAAGDNGGAFDRGRMEKLLAGLGSRVFLMNNVHEDSPVTFHVRWVMSYLRGPLTRRQIKTLMDPKRDAFEMPEEKAVTSPAVNSLASAQTASKPEPVAPAPDRMRPALSSRIDQSFVRLQSFERENLVYKPAIIRAAEVMFDDTKVDLYEKRILAFIHPVKESTRSFSETDEIIFGLPLGNLEMDPITDQAEFEPLPAMAKDSTNYTAIKNDFINWIYREYKVELLKSPMLEMVSKPGEDENDFRVRMRDRAREVRDEKTDELRKKYATKLKRIEDQIDRAEVAVEREESQAKSAKMQTMINIGSSLLGAFVGRKSSVVSRGATAARGASRAWQQGRDVDRAEEKVRDLQREFEDMERELQDEIHEVTDSIDPLTERLEKVRISPKKKDINIHAVGLAWLPHHKSTDGGLTEAWME